MTIVERNAPYNIIRDCLLQADERTVFRAMPNHMASRLSLVPRPMLEGPVKVQSLTTVHTVESFHSDIRDLDQPCGVYRPLG